MYFHLYDNTEAVQHSGFNPEPLFDIQATQNDENMADFMITLWTNFVKFGYMYKLLHFHNVYYFKI